jgi:HPr kinase/phosphorylase
VSVHGVAVSLGDIGLLIRGKSGVGKTRFAAGLMADQRLGVTHLVADDRVLVARMNNRLVARPHPVIAGLMEIRGVGLCHAKALDAVILRAIIEFGENYPERLPD